MGFSHVFSPDSLKNTLLSQGHVLGTTPTVGMVGWGTFQKQGRSSRASYCLCSSRVPVPLLLITSSKVFFCLKPKYMITKQQNHIFESWCSFRQTFSQMVISFDNKWEFRTHQRHILGSVFLIQVNLSEKTKCKPSLKISLIFTTTLQYNT